ncbi:PadR family transcriptional regulator [Ornithinimicrobium sediminis]|uniref:PadR family transcriptional regulator n=1 Tax=Ornithinimicrobium sediminis TaxID=2904603 RepID=UPI001E581F7E|nr:PadR family transcriptional regulator [Ornithinimicrobium sediminis]
MSRRSDMLELAILGLLHDVPLHGYELRKQVHRVLGTVRALSYGTLYPRLRDLVDRGLLVETGRPVPGRRARITYAVTPAGRERFTELLAAAGPSAWEDDAFAVHFAFFGRTETGVRLRILEGRRARLEERLDAIRASGPALSGTTQDNYAMELHRHGLESTEADLRWVSRMIEAERLHHERAATSRGSTLDKE